MRLLITNDDGVDAPGILTLARTAAKAGHEVLVSAPATQQSAAGHWFDEPSKRHEHFAHD